MMGWRARIGFLVPPGNPTVEPEMTELAPPGVSVHFTRMSASGPAGTHAGQEERNRSQIASLDEATRLLAMVSPHVIVLAHTATSYTLGREAEALPAAVGARRVGVVDEHRLAPDAVVEGPGGGLGTGAGHHARGGRDLWSSTSLAPPHASRCGL